jgi:hypothetical protein
MLHALLHREPMSKAFEPIVVDKPANDVHLR